MSKKKKILRSFLVLLGVAGIVILSYFVLVWTGLWEKVNSVEKLKNYILAMGFWGRMMFVFLQFLQVTFVPIPSPILVIAGSIIYGPLQSSLLSLSGILLGSTFAFFLGRVFGRKLVNFMVGSESEKKWVGFLNKSKYSFVLMMILPLFPDDILCLVAGLTDMSWRFFVITQFITRPIGIFLTSYFSSGEIIPYEGWGLIVWTFILIFAVLSIYLSTKYSEKIEKYVKSMFKNSEKKH